MKPSFVLHCGSAFDILPTLADDSVDCSVTSPPYFGLRDYGVAGQLGLESTPEEYVARMVQVFREVRRVLKDDGTLWLNLGDSYASGGRTTRDLSSPNKGNLGASQSNRPRDGLKPKDLVGIPWRVAFALQQPYYSGSIKDERDRIWLAAMLDAEGCMFIHRRKAGQHNGQGYYRQNDSFGPGVEIANTSQALVERILAIVGKGSICSQSPDQNTRRKQTIFRWNLRTTESVDFVRELYPHLVAKQRQARILCGCPSSGDVAARAHVSLISLHRGHDTDFDLAAPQSLNEKGWYLRSDVIWSKANPMPESVTDRPTKSHEYLFLLTRGERYFYDADAIREPHGKARDWPTWEERKAGGAAMRRGDPSISGDICRWAGVGGNPLGRNKRSVWTVATQPFPEAHFAVMPEALVEPCIRAGCRPGGIVLDPFAGAGTVGVVAIRERCGFVGIELNPEYVTITNRRIDATLRQHLLPLPGIEHAEIEVGLHG